MPISPVTDVLKATYSDLKTVKSRSVCQLILELPIEALTDVVGLLGAPVPGSEVWVAVARLRQGGAEPVSEPEQPVLEHQPEPELPKRKSLAQVAGILCSSKAFQKWSGNATADEAAEWLRGHCNITSRSQLDTNEDAAAIFRDMRGDFDAWMLAPEAYSPREVGVAA